MCLRCDGMPLTAQFPGLDVLVHYCSPLPHRMSHGPKYLCQRGKRQFGILTGINRKKIESVLPLMSDTKPQHAWCPLPLFWRRRLQATAVTGKVLGSCLHDWWVAFNICAFPECNWNVNKATATLGKRLLDLTLQLVNTYVAQFRVPYKICTAEGWLCWCFSIPKTHFCPAKISSTC